MTVCIVQRLDRVPNRMGIEVTDQKSLAHSRGRYKEQVQPRHSFPCDLSTTARWT